MWDHKTWDDVGYVTLDIESTGFGKSAQVVEVAAVLARRGEISHVFHSFVNPGVPIPEDATAVHGIDDSMVCDAPTMDEIASSLFTVLDLGPWVAHNLNFDIRMMKQSLSPQGLKHWSVGVPTFCSLAAAKETLRIRNNKLTDVATALGIDHDFEKLHGARADAELLAKVVPRLFSGGVVDSFKSARALKYSDQWL